MAHEDLHGGDGGGHGGMDHEGGGMDHEGGAMQHMMSMSFHFGYEETILFEWWKTATQNELLLAVFIIAVVAALYEGIKYSRALLLRASNRHRATRTLPDSTTALHSTQTEPHCAETMFSCNHFSQTLLHAVQITVSYLLMLVFMTYNVWLCIAVVVGATIGYFLFGWRTCSMAVGEHCH